MTQNGIIINGSQSYDLRLSKEQNLELKVCVWGGGADEFHLPSAE